MLVIFIIEIVGAILAFVYYPQVENFVISSMDDYDPRDPNDTVTAAWDAVQRAVSVDSFIFVILRDIC